MPFSEGPNFEWKSVDESRIKLDSGEFKHIKIKKLEEIFFSNTCFVFKERNYLWNVIKRFRETEMIVALNNSHSDEE